MDQPEAVQFRHHASRVNRMRKAARTLQLNQP